MKLLYIMNKIDGRGGLNRIAFDKINYLIDYYEIEVIYYGKSTSMPFYKVDGRVKFHNIEVNAFASFGKKMAMIYKVYADYVRLVKKIHPDIIINMNVNILSWIIPFVRKRTPKIIELHQSYDGVKIFNDNAFGKDNWKGKFSFFLRNTIYPLYDKVIVLTHTDQKKWGYRNIEVIPNFTNMPQTNDTLVKSHNFIWVGRLSHQKGIDFLIKIWDRFIKENEDWRLILIGNDPTPNSILKKTLLDYLVKTKADNRIQYIEETKNMPKYYDNSSIYISTSRYEGLPLCLVEAATMGKPIIGFDITGNDEVVDNRVNGILIPPADIDSYVKAMQELAVNEERREVYGKAALVKAQSFKKETIMLRWRNLFVEMQRKK